MKNPKTFLLEVRVTHCYEHDDLASIRIPVQAFIGADGEIVLKALDGAELARDNDYSSPEPHAGVTISDSDPWERKERVQRTRLERRLESARRRLTHSSH